MKRYSAISSYLKFLTLRNESEENDSSVSVEISIKEVRREIRTAIHSFSPNSKNEEEQVIEKGTCTSEEEDVIGSLLDIISFYPSTGANCSTGRCDPKVGLYSVRLISNIVTNNEGRSRGLFGRLEDKKWNKRTKWSEMIYGFSSKSEDSLVSYSLFMEAICTLLYNSYTAVPYDDDSLLQDRNFVLMLLCSDEQMAMFLLTKLYSMGLFRLLYQSMNDSNSTAVTENHIKLLQIFVSGDPNVLQLMIKDDLRRNTLSFLAEHASPLLTFHDKLANQNQSDSKALDCCRDSYDLIIEIFANYFQTEDSAKVHEDRIYMASNHVYVLRCVLLDLHNILHPLLLQKQVEAKSTEKRQQAKSAKQQSLPDIERTRVLSIVRLIGNLCYQCPIHQDLLREEITSQLNYPQDNDETLFFNMTGLQLLLSSTSLSFVIGVGIQEWCIIAIRYAVEDSIENQKIIQDLQRIP